MLQNTLKMCGLDHRRPYKSQMYIVCIHANSVRKYLNNQPQQNQTIGMLTFKINWDNRNHHGCRKALLQLSMFCQILTECRGPR